MQRSIDPRAPQFKRPFVLAGVFLVLLAALFGGRPLSPAAALCGGFTEVGDETELNAAIAAFNSQAAACEFGIRFKNSIDLIADATPIDKMVTGLTLQIDGAGYQLSGSTIALPIQIVNADKVEIENLAIMYSDGNGITQDNANLRLKNVAVLRNKGNGLESSGGSTTIYDSTFAYNQRNGIEAYNPSVGLNIINSTIAANGDGGISTDQRNLTLIHVTVAENRFGVRAVGGFIALGISNSILAGNDEEDCGFGGTTISIFYSLLGSESGSRACGMTDGADGNIVGHDPLLLPLGNYGNPVPIMPPAQYDGGVTALSPAINAGSDALSVGLDDEPLPFDQRGDGFPRRIGTVDMGAIERPIGFICPNFPVSVSSEFGLNEVIGCFNAATAGGVYRVNLAADIVLSDMPRLINNPTPGVSLLINGNGHTIDGQDLADVRPLTIANGTTVTLNNATLTGGNSDSDGGGIHNRGDLTINDSRIEFNTTDEDGGGIYNSEGATLAVDNSAIADNTADFSSGDGGGLANEGTATLTDVSVSGNQALAETLPVGGGILNKGVMILTRATISGNLAHATEEGAKGGGIANRASLIIRDSLISDNQSVADEESARGGGIFSDASDSYSLPDGVPAQLMIINTTISGNTASADERVYGGGLYAEDCCTDDGGAVTLINVTLSDNTADGVYDTLGGGAFFYGGDEGLDITIHNSILANSTSGGSAGGDCAFDYTNISLISFDTSHSLYEDTATGACFLTAPGTNGNIVGEDPNLGPLANNGGPTDTQLPNAGSPVIDSGSDALAVDEEGGSLAADQRGYVLRVVGAAVDMGALEVGAEPPPDPAVFVSAKQSGTTGDGEDFDNSDILMWDGSEWTKFFDGTDAHLDPTNKPKHNINAFWIDDNDDIIMSFAQNARKVGGLAAKVDGTDLVKWDGSAFSLWFDGSDVGLTKKTGEKIDGLHVLPGDQSPIGGACAYYLLISTQGAGDVPAFGGKLKFGGEDVLGFCATNLGETTAGFWHMALDGSAVGLPKNSLDSISASDDGDTLTFTTSKVTFLGGHSMVFAYDGSTFSGPLFVPADNGLGQTVDGLQTE